MGKQRTSNNYTRRLPKARYETLRAFCLSARGEDLDMLHRIANEVTGDALGWWIVRAVTSKNWPWARLEAHHIPASYTTYYNYRNRFFRRLEEELRKKDPPPSSDPGGGEANGNEAKHEATQT